MNITICVENKRNILINAIGDFYNEPPDIAFPDSRLRRVGRVSGMADILYLMNLVTEEENNFVHDLVIAVMGDKPYPDRPGTLIPEVS